MIRHLLARLRVHRLRSRLQEMRLYVGDYRATVAYGEQQIQRLEHALRQAEARLIAAEPSRRTIRRAGA